MPIKKFPEFTYLRMHHKEMVNEYLKDAQPHASELTFANMFIWRRTRALGLSDLEGALVISEMSPLGELSYYPPVTHKDVLASTISLIEKAENNNEKFAIDSITEPLAGQLREEGYNVEPDRKNWDYVYKASNLGDPNSSKHESRNLLIRKFMEKFEGRCRYVDMDKDLANTCLGLRDWREPGWCLGKLKLLEEPYAIVESLKYFSDLGLMGGVVYMDDELAGFTIGERMSDNMAVVHSEKANHKYPGLHQYLNMEFISRLPDEVEWINMEQDLGDTGLRRAMNRYEPDHHVEKFILRVGD